MNDKIIEWSIFSNKRTGVLGKSAVWEENMVKVCETLSVGLPLSLSDQAAIHSSSLKRGRSGFDSLRAQDCNNAWDLFEKS